MTEEERILFQIWACKQDKLRRGDIIDRSRSEKHKALIRSNIETTDREIERLQERLRTLRELQKGEQENA